MTDKTSDFSIKTAVPELYLAEGPLKATNPLPAVSTAGISMMETTPPKESSKCAPTTDKPMAGRTNDQFRQSTGS